MHSNSTLEGAETWGRIGVLGLLGLGVGFGVAIVPTSTEVGLDLALAVASAGLVGLASAIGARLHDVASLPLELAPVASRGTSGGETVYRFRAQLGRGRTAHDPRVTVAWQASEGRETTLHTFVPATTLCGPFTLLARDPDGVVEGEGRFVVRVEVRSAGETWSAERHIVSSEVTEGPFDGVELHRRGVRFTGAWQRVTTPLEDLPPR